MVKFSGNDHRSGVWDKNQDWAQKHYSYLIYSLQRKNQGRQEESKSSYWPHTRDSVNRQWVFQVQWSQCCRLESRVFRDDKNHLVANNLCVKENELERETKPGRMDVLSLWAIDNEKGSFTSILWVQLPVTSTKPFGREFLTLVPEAFF